VTGLLRRLLKKHVVLGAEPTQEVNGFVEKDTTQASSFRRAGNFMLQLLENDSSVLFFRLDIRL
jgi:hypothetical protein